MEVNILGVLAVGLFILIPVSFLLILYVKSAAEDNVSGNSDEYWEQSFKLGNKKVRSQPHPRGLPPP